LKVTLKREDNLVNKCLQLVVQLIILYKQGSWDIIHIEQVLRVGRQYHRRAFVLCHVEGRVPYRREVGKIICS